MSPGCGFVGSAAAYLPKYSSGTQGALGSTPVVLKIWRIKPTQLNPPGPSDPSWKGAPNCAIPTLRASPPAPPAGALFAGTPVVPSVGTTFPRPSNIWALAKNPNERTRTIIRPRSTTGLTLRGMSSGLLPAAYMTYCQGVYPNPPSYGSAL